EYLVAKGLDNPEDLARIHKSFCYFIVDEFQDTSALQFSIIQKLIGNNFERLFCVGDAKQAIYGFRGGELSVFQDCEKLVPTVRSLANNYRSLPEIICFNNSLFRTILPLAQGFEGHDAFTVIPEDQNVPPGEREEKGVIEVHRAALTVDGEERKDFSSGDLFRLEAHFLSNSIADERSKYPHQ